MPAQEERKAKEDMDHEELVAALPELREEAAKADTRGDKTLVILLKDETYDRLIAEVQDPAEIAAKINEARGGAPDS